MSQLEHADFVAATDRYRDYTDGDNSGGSYVVNRQPGIPGYR